MNNAAGISKNKFLGGRVFIFLGMYLGVKLPNHMVTLFNLLRNCHTALKVDVALYSPITTTV